MIERWLMAIRDHPKRPPMAQCHVLTMLALRMDWATGRGFASAHQLSADSGANERTVRRATSWARGDGYLVQVKRGHYISAERNAATVWQLSQPDTGDLLAEPTGQNGKANRTAKRANRTPEPAYQESVVLQESSSSSRALRADARDDKDPVLLGTVISSDDDAVKQLIGGLRAELAAKPKRTARRSDLCPGCGRAPRTGHGPGCQQDTEP